ncbi:MAG: VWA domain-containing protein [Thermoguttaceae bacterium]
MMSCRCHVPSRLGRFLLAMVWLATVATLDSRVVAQQVPQNDVEGLGFSMAPKEGGKARTSLFGVVGEGYKFVYVFDRSGSMGGSGQRALRAAKGELIRSLEPLDTVHQFQLIFYNEQPLLFNPSGTPGRLAFATDANKRRAIRFIESVQADGGTNHEDALRLAIRLQPDVIFLLTDADEPTLTAAQLDKIRTLAAGIVINAIEFGDGPKPAGASFLETLARENGGGYAYVDLSKRAADGREKKQ